jgi:replication factor A1
LDKRDIFLVDKSGTETCLTLWGNEAKNFSIPLGTVIGVKGALVKEFNGEI